MLNDQYRHDPIESALRRVEAAEKADVFGRSPVDADALLRSAGSKAPLSFTRKMMRIVPLAAAAMLVVGVWGTMWNTQLGKLRSQKLAMVENDCDGSFLKCFQGPSDQNAVCGTYDYDSDGDIDLADFGTYQMSCDGPVAVR